MIVRPHPTGLLCVGQASHAWISGQLLRDWGNERFARPEPFDEVCLGAEQHDVGMAEYDLAPDLDPDTGGPCSFMDMPLATHLDLWSRAPRRLLTQSPYAALLCSMHGHALYDDDDSLEPDPEDSAAVARFVAEREAFQSDLIARLAEDPANAAHNQQVVWAVDFLSLSCFMDWDPESVPAPTRRDADPVELRVRRDGTTLHVDPWPFGGPELTVTAAGRILEHPQPTKAALHRALEDAPWVRLSYELRPES